MQKSMGAAIPKTIKNKVLALYLQGLTRRKIAKSLKISTGSVSNILVDFRNEIPQLDLARGVGKMCQVENWDMRDLSIAMHFKKQINSMGLSEEQIEELIEYAHNYCFDRASTIEEFVKLVFTVGDLSERLVVPPTNLPQYLDKLRL